MADPVSSVAYAIEAALRALDGDPASLVATMSLVVGIIVVVATTYHQLIGRFPSGAGGPKAVATAFGDDWVFLPLGALLVDFTLTVAVSCSAGAAAAIAYVPDLESLRLPIALALAVLVALGVLVGHRGRIGFAIAAQAFILMAAAVIVVGFLAEPASGAAGGASAPGGPLLADASLAAVLTALPLGMALATGVEAPSDAIAQLPQLPDRPAAAVRPADAVVDGRDRRRPDALLRRVDRAPRRGAARRRLDPARRGGATGGRRRLAAGPLPGAQRTAAARRGRLLVSRRFRRAEGPRRAGSRRRTRAPAGAVAPRKPLPRRPLGRVRGARRRRGDDRRRGRRGAEAGALLRRLGLRQLSRGHPGVRPSDPP